MSRDFSTPELFFLLQALRWTLLLTLVAFIGGGLGGFIVAIARISPLRGVRWLASLFVGLLQGTPLLLQLFVAFYGLTVVTGLRLDPWPAVALAFTLYAAAFLGDIWRGALEAIPRTQWEAGTALGLRRWATMRTIILPQAARIAIPPTVGFLVQLIKNTSVAAIVGFVELTRAGQLMVNVTFQPMIVYPVVAALLFRGLFPISFAAGRLEAHLDARQGRV